MPFYVVQDRSGYKFEDGVLERGLKRVTVALETDINLVQVVTFLALFIHPYSRMRKTPVIKKIRKTRRRKKKTLVLILKTSPKRKLILAK